MALLEWCFTHLAAVAAAVIFTYVIISTVYSWFRLRNVPGPFMAGLTYLWAATLANSGREAWIYYELAKKYGHLIRVGPNLVLTDDPDVLRRMSGTRSTYGKDRFYNATIKVPDADNMFSTIDVRQHDKIKAQLAASYGGRETLGMEPIVDDLIDELIQHVRNKCTKGPELTAIMDFAEVVDYLTMDIITRVAFGRELGFLRTDTDVHGLLAANRASVRVLTGPISIPWLRDITSSTWFGRWLGPKPTDKTGVGAIMA